jgi:hypothetical protein
MLPMRVEEWKVNSRRGLSQRFCSCGSAGPPQLLIRGSGSVGDGAVLWCRECDHEWAGSFDGGHVPVAPPTSGLHQNVH